MLSLLDSLESVQKIFTIFEAMYGNLWTTSRSTPDAWEMAHNLWADQLKVFSIETLSLAAKRTYTHHKEFPPTLGQFHNVCKMIAKENKPTTVDLMRKDEEKIRSIEHLVDTKSGASSVARQENAKSKAILAGKLRDIAPLVSTAKFEKDKIDRNSKTFDKHIAAQRESYLLNVSEYDALSLDINDRYDRHRLLAQIDTSHNETAYEDDRRAGRVVTPVIDPEASIGDGKYKAKNVIKNWMDGRD